MAERIAQAPVDCAFRSGGGWTIPGPGQVAATVGLVKTESQAARFAVMPCELPFPFGEEFRGSIFSV